MNGGGSGVDVGGPTPEPRSTFNWLLALFRPGERTLLRPRTLHVLRTLHALPAQGSGKPDDCGVLTRTQIPSAHDQPARTTSAMGAGVAGIRSRFSPHASAMRIRWVARSWPCGMRCAHE